MPKLNEVAIVEEDHCSPYHHQGAYKNDFSLPSPASNYSDAEISPDIENSYIQQNLPVRRQSLIVYHDKIRNENMLKQQQSDPQSPKRHSSLNFPTTVAAEEMTEERKSRLYNSKSLNAIHSKSEDYRKSRMPYPPLTIEITHPESSASTSTLSCASNSPFELSMDTLFEEDRSPLSPSQQAQVQQQLPQRQSIPRFIGLLRPSKSETIYNNKKNDKLTTPVDLHPSSPLSTSWNDNMSQPLSRLRNVFSRLQTNTASVNPNNTPNTIKPSTSTSKRMSMQVMEAKKKKRISTAIKGGAGDNKSRKKKTAANIYTALLSHVSKEFLKRMQISTIAFKDGIQYHDVFHGIEAVNCILDILCTSDRNLALLVGRALESQGLFHHVNYDYRLRDTESELYQFQYLQSQQDTPPTYGGRPPIPSQFTTNSSTKLLSLKKSNRRNAPSVCETLPINGVFSVLTDCYSPTCTRKSPCYSISCPRMMAKKNKSMQRPLSSQFLRTEQEKQLRSLWRHSVPRNIVMGTNDIEQKRQECIYELIYTEEDFTRDMHYVQDFWIEPLLNNDIIPIDRRHQFIRDVFWNLADIERISMALSRDLTSRQDKHSVIPCIGDILLEHVKGFEPFVIYGAHQIFGKHKFELEKKRNAKLLQFAQTLERQPESRRLELNGYLTKPTSRLGRYNLLLSTIHHLTPKDHQDYETIPKVIDMITEFMVQLNKQVGLSDNAFHLELISSRIIVNKGSFVSSLSAGQAFFIFTNQPNTGFELAGPKASTPDAR
ncbi:RHO1 GDP-GTP exchange protein 2, variant 3 [Mucor circinelloides]